MKEHLVSLLLPVFDPAFVVEFLCDAQLCVDVIGTNQVRLQPLGALEGFAHDLGRERRWDQIRRATAQRAQREHPEKQKPFSTRENMLHESFIMPEKLDVSKSERG